MSKTTPAHPSRIPTLSPLLTGSRIRPPFSALLITICPAQQLRHRTLSGGLTPNLVEPWRSPWFTSPSC